jgi:thiamine-monophosphate kinase
MAFIEGVHFDLSICNAQELGHRVIAMALSDLVASGATPLHCQITLAVPQDFSETFLMQMQSGWNGLRKRFGFSVALSPWVLSPNGLGIFLATAGSAPKKAAFLRKPVASDILAVTGAIGGSIAALRCIKAYGRHDLRQDQELVQPHILPQPRVKETDLLLKSKSVTGWVELVDGLAAELNRFCSDHSVGAEIEEASLPVHPQAKRAAQKLGTPDAIPSWVLYGAEDFEFLVALDPKGFTKAQKAMKRLGTALTVIGRLTKKKGTVEILRPDGSQAVLENKMWHPLVRRRKA